MPAIQVKTILPNVPSLPPLLVKRARDQLTIIGDRMIGDYRKTTRTWTHKPAFTKRLQVTTAYLSVTAGTDNEVYGFVDKGTRRHWIHPKPTNKWGRLFFKPGYVAKTTPRIIGSKQGGSFGNVVAAKKVDHPGNVGRHFTVTIQRKWKPIFDRRLQGVMRDIARDYEKQSRSRTQ